MTVVCAWCGRTLQRGGAEVSHGICAQCSRKVESRLVERWIPPAAQPRARRRAVRASLPLPGF